MKKTDYHSKAKEMHEVITMVRAIDTEKNKVSASKRVMELRYIELMDNIKKENERFEERLNNLRNTLVDRLCDEFHTNRATVDMIINGDIKPRGTN